MNSLENNHASSIMMSVVYIFYLFIFFLLICFTSCQMTNDAMKN